VNALNVGAGQNVELHHHKGADLGSPEAPSLAQLYAVRSHDA